jgi:hypothetical protein
MLVASMSSIADKMLGLSTRLQRLLTAAVLAKMAQTMNCFGRDWGVRPAVAGSTNEGNPPVSDPYLDANERLYRRAGTAVIVGIDVDHHDCNPWTMQFRLLTSRTLRAITM